MGLHSVLPNARKIEFVPKKVFQPGVNFVSSSITFYPRIGNYVYQLGCKKMTVYSADDSFIISERQSTDFDLDILPLSFFEDNTNEEITSKDNPIITTSDGKIEKILRFPCLTYDELKDAFHIPKNYIKTIIYDIFRKKNEMTKMIFDRSSDINE